MIIEPLNLTLDRLFKLYRRSNAKPELSEATWRQTVGFKISCSLKTCITTSSYLPIRVNKIFDLYESKVLRSLRRKLDDDAIS